MNLKIFTIWVVQAPWSVGLQHFIRGSRLIYKRKATRIKSVSQASALGKKGARSVDRIYLVTQVLSKTVQGELTDLQRSRNMFRDFSK